MDSSYPIIWQLHVVRTKTPFPVTAACILSAVCQDGDLRVISNMSSPIEGSLEICINNSYGGICDDFWDVQDATVACRQLGFSNGTVETVSVCINFQHPFVCVQSLNR
jgi:hypothetical protein